jgi:hypothetical protein
MWLMMGFPEDDGTFKTISCGTLIADEDSFE